MRELSLGLVRPGELLWVLVKETKIGIINGLVLGLLLGGNSNRMLSICREDHYFITV
jgi:Mg/Co/Ni transporter MgtE